MIMNAVNCDVPYKYIRETVTGTQEEGGGINAVESASTT